jgi:6-hydroxytryprostatin B O-methyltransferase
VVQPSLLQLIIHFNIPSHIPLSGTISYPTLALAAHVPESHLKRILRLAMTNDLFTEPTPNHVAHSPSLLDYATHCLKFSFPVSTKLPEMTARWAGSTAKTETAFNLAFATDLPMFARLMGAM